MHGKSGKGGNGGSPYDGRGLVHQSQPRNFKEQRLGVYGMLSGARKNPHFPPITAPE